MPDKKLHWETLQVHAGYSPEPTTHAVAVPIYQTSSYEFDDCANAKELFSLKAEGNVYSRMMNPTTDVFEKRMAALDGGVGALAASSGMAATLLAVTNIAVSGDNVVSSNTVYGGTYNLFANTLPKFGITAKFFHPDDLKALENSIDARTKAVFIEALGNPNCNIADVSAIAKIAHAHGIPLIVDNTFAPYLIRPFELGADIIVYSATKFIGGHGTSVGGILIDGGKFDWKKSGRFDCLVSPDPSYHGITYTEAFGAAAYIVKARGTMLRDLGCCISPFNSFLLLQGLETLSLRIERHIQNTQKIVAFLDAHPKVKLVNYPTAKGNKYAALAVKYFPKGAGSIFTFELKSGAADAIKFVNALKVFTLLANVADAKSLVIHPATTTHGQMNEQELLDCGITQGTIRLSVGIEHADDLIDDLTQALDKI